VGFELTTSVVKGIDCRGSAKSNYHVITTTTDPIQHIQYTVIQHTIKYNIQQINKNDTEYNKVDKISIVQYLILR
jgi:hypothetical protein